jgi:tetratricopeptide (TPR) repeat protein
MFLTHIDEEGRDSPAIRIENATAANRAVNIPEFVNIPPHGLMAIDVPAADFYRVFSRGLELSGQGKFEAAIAEWNRAIELAPEDAKAHNYLGFALAQQGRPGDALFQLQKAVALNPSYSAGHNNLALTLESLGRIGEAIQHWRTALELNPASAAVHNNLAGALYPQGRTAEALLHWRAVLRVEPDRPSALQKTAWVLATASEASLRDGRQAVVMAERAVKLTGGGDPAALDTLAAAYAEAGRFADAVGTGQRALELAAAHTDQALIEGLTERIALYRVGTPFRERTTGAVYQK